MIKQDKNELNGNLKKSIYSFLKKLKSYKSWLRAFAGITLSEFPFL